MNAFENITCCDSCVPAKQVEEKVLQVASYLGITDILYKFPYEVSEVKTTNCSSSYVVADPASFS